MPEQPLPTTATLFLVGDISAVLDGSSDRGTDVDIFGRGHQSGLIFVRRATGGLRYNDSRTVDEQLLAKGR